MSKNNLWRAELQIPVRLSSISTLTFALAVLRSKIHTLARPLLFTHDSAGTIHDAGTLTGHPEIIPGPQVGLQEVIESPG
jgi:hypothetical protein